MLVISNNENMIYHGDLVDDIKGNRTFFLQVHFLSKH